ncbi:MAG: transporter ATP-binding protein [Gemmataceae bacterium]|nr:transporter ATP-binding protein [Gemmataceae bacterium]
MPASDHSRSAARLVVGLLRPHRRRVALAAVLTTAGCLSALAIPLLLRWLVDRAAGGTGAVPLPIAVPLLLAALVVQAGCGVGATLLVGRVAIDVACALRRRVYDQLLRVELGVAPGVALSRLTDDVACVQNLITAQTVGVLADLGTAAVVAGWLVWQSPPLFVVAAVVALVAAAHFRYHARRIRAGAADVRGRLDRIFVQLQEKIDGAVVVKGHGREAEEEADFADRMADAHPPRVRLGRLTTGLSVGGQLLGGAGATAVFLAAVSGVIRGDLTPGEAAAVAAFAGLLFGPLARLADVAGVYEQAAASGDRLARLTALPAGAVADPVCPVPLGRARGLIEFDAVGFAYEPGRSVLTDVRLRVEPGERVAVVGPTGCGKSTLLALLLRFHDPAWGEVRVDNVSLRRLALADLRRQIGLVPQDPTVFRGTLADNIRYGCPDADMARVEAAAAAAGVDAIARRLPHGYETVIGAGEAPLSAGERQRVAIARAVCLDPPVVLLDEATANLDPAAEAEVRAALAGLLRGRTAVIVAHRLATVRDADRIVVLDGGRVVQAGRHADLLRETGGLYHRFVARQFGPPAAA